MASSCHSHHPGVRLRCTHLQRHLRRRWENHGQAVQAGPKPRLGRHSATIVSTTNPDGAKALIADTEGTTFVAATGTGNAVLKLAKPAVISAAQVSVSAYTSSRFEPQKSFTLQTSNDGDNWTTVSCFFGKDAFSYHARRPVVPDVHYKRFKLVAATYVRLWADEAIGDTKTSVQTGDFQVYSAPSPASAPAANLHHRPGEALDNAVPVGNRRDLEKSFG